MLEIEWHDTHEYQPAEYSIHSFCQANRIAADHFANSSGLIVFIERQALEGLNDFVAHDIQREHGGVLAGQPYYDPEEKRFFVVIRVAIPAHDTEGTPVHLQFTSETWSYIAGIIEENFSDLVIVGWYHSHPGLGVFMSGTDRATQRAFFNHPWSLAVVVDPIAQKTSWFSGPDCTVVDQAQTLLYDERLAVETTEISVESSYPPIEDDAKEMRRLSWLLPFLGIVFLAGGLAMLFLKKRAKGKDCSGIS